MKLSIITPIYNEEETIRPLVEKISDVCEREKYDFEIILVDDGSTDLSAEVMKEMSEDDPRVKAVHFQRNFGQAAAMSAGFDYATGDLIVTIDADLQNDPKDIPRLIAKMDEGYDIVSGWRKGRMDNILRIIPSVIANKMIKWTTGVDLHDIGCTLKVYRKSIVQNINVTGGNAADVRRAVGSANRQLLAAMNEAPRYG